MDVRTAAKTTADPEQVWALLADLEAWPRWTPTVTTVRALGERPFGVGSRFAVEQPRLGRSTYEITEWQPGAGFSWAARRAGVRTLATHAVRPASEGAEVELGITWSGPGRGLVRLLYGRLTRRYVATELASLVAAAEGTA